jgi:hypothetical protein
MQRVDLEISALDAKLKKCLKIFQVAITGSLGPVGPMGVDLLNDVVLSDCVGGGSGQWFGKVGIEDVQPVPYPLQAASLGLLGFCPFLE